MRSEEDKDDVLRVRDGKLYIEVSHCVHCERLMLAPITDECICGGEMYPVSKLVPLGEHVTVEEMKGW